MTNHAESKNVLILNEEFVSFKSGTVCIHSSGVAVWSAETCNQRNDTEWEFFSCSEGFMMQKSLSAAATQWNCSIFSSANVCAGPGRAWSLHYATCSVSSSLYITHTHTDSHI